MELVRKIMSISEDELYEAYRENEIRKKELSETRRRYEILQYEKQSSGNKVIELKSILESKSKQIKKLCRKHKKQLKKVRSEYEAEILYLKSKLYEKHEEKHHIYDVSRISIQDIAKIA
jgi:septin family protein